MIRINESYYWCCFECGVFARDCCAGGGVLALNVSDSHINFSQNASFAFVLLCNVYNLSVVWSVQNKQNEPRCQQTCFFSLFKALCARGWCSE